MPVYYEPSVTPQIHSKRKLSIADRDEMRARRRAGEKLDALAAHYRVHDSFASKVCRGITPARPARALAEVVAGAVAERFGIEVDALRQQVRSGRPCAGDQRPRARKVLTLALRLHGGFGYPAITAVVGSGDLYQLCRSAATDLGVVGAAAEVARRAGLTSEVP